MESAKPGRGRAQRGVCRSDVALRPVRFRDPRMTDDGMAALWRAAEALGDSTDAGDRESAAAARGALEECERVADWRSRLLSDEAVEAVAGELFAQDATEAIRDARGGWHKDRLRRAARSLLIAAIDAAAPPDGPAAE